MDMTSFIDDFFRCHFFAFRKNSLKAKTENNKPAIWISDPCWGSPAKAIEEATR